MLEALPLDVEISEQRLSAAQRSTRAATRFPRRRSRPASSADAVLLGAVGGPQWDGGPVRPEAGLIGLRKELDVYANLRPAVGDGHRPADRARAGRRPLLRRARRSRGRHRLRHLRVPPGPGGAASRGARSSSRAAARAAALGRQGERARDLAHVAAGRHGARRRLPRRRAEARARRQRRDAARHRSRRRSTCS